MTLTDTLRSQVKAKHLLDHPFYQRWNNGDLTRDELQDYARQYYHYSLAFPTFVSSIHANSNDMVTRQALLENLIEEERGPENHPELWLRFCEALGVDRDDVLTSSPSESTRHLISVMKGLSRNGAVHEGLAALYAYESQVPAVSQTKIDGLKKFYEIDAPRDIAFFSVHIEADVHHSKTSEDLLATICNDDQKRGEASAAAQSTLDALYGFLDGVNHPVEVLVN